MVYQHHIGLRLNCGVEQRLAGGDSADDAAHLGAALDLQAVGTVVGDARGIQVAIALGDQGIQGNGHGDAP
ncbi:hypothetical protein D3C77_754510 [compost metagenome]